MWNEREEAKRELKEIEAEIETRRKAYMQLVNDETEKGYQADQDLKNIGRQMEHLRSDSQLYPLLSEQERTLKKMQRDRMDLLTDTQAKHAIERRNLEARAEEHKARLN